MKYFAYGSNMNQDRMTNREVNFTSRQFGKLANHKLVFNKKATNGGYSFANIVPSENDYVEGAIYELPDHEITNLDRAEGYPYHYGRIEVTVTDKNSNPVKACAYVANADHIENGLCPTNEYLGHLLAGQDILSKDYYDWLKKTETCD